MLAVLRRRARRGGLLAGVAAGVVLLATPGAVATHGPEAEVTVGSNDAVMLQNKQNEPAVAVNPVDPSIVAAGANDNIDLEGCNNGTDNTCPFTTGVGVTGVQFSLDGGQTWTQPTYTGYSARDCVGVPGPDDVCTPDEDGPIGTLPWYFEEGLVADGDPAVAWGPKPDGAGGFTYADGARLYFATLAGNFSAERDEQTFKGFEALAVSRTDDARSAAAGNKAAWMRPVIVSKQSSATFSDKEFIWADNAESSPFFGNVYVCNVSFRSVGGAPEPVVFHRSTDGGDTWTTRQLSPAANTGLGHGRQGCTLRTDSDGVVYVFYRGGDTGQKEDPPFVDRAILMTRSFDGGRTFDRPRAVTPNTQECGRFDPVQRRLTFDGIAGARTNIGPSADIANGAPSGAGAPDTIVLNWCDGPTPTATSPGPNEQAFVQLSFDKGETWTTPMNAASASDRPDFPAVAISPDGTDVYLTYMNFLQPWQPSALAPARNMQGVVRYAPLAGTTLGAFEDRHRGDVGDSRGSTANSLAFGFLGDYNYVSATNSFAVAVWNDTRNAADCPAIDAYRQSIVDGDPTAAPAPQQECPPVGTDLFGNTDIFGTVVTP